MAIGVDDSDSREEGSSESGGDLLLEFLRRRTIRCPKCDYNLRDLTRPVCPECGEELTLTVGRRKVRDTLLFVTLAPCIFSGIAAVLFSSVIAWVVVIEREPGLPVEMWVVLAFGWISGLGGLLLFFRRSRFIKLDRNTQWMWALGLWAVHVAAFALLIAYS